jgi:hypothetical protein
MALQTNTSLKFSRLRSNTEKNLFFNPQQLQPVQVPGKSDQVYNNVSLGWNGEDGLEAVHKIISILLKREEREERAAA